MKVEIIKNGISQQDIFDDVASGATDIYKRQKQKIMTLFETPEKERVDNTMDVEKHRNYMSFPLTMDRDAIDAGASSHESYLIMQFMRYSPGNSNSKRADKNSFRERSAKGNEITDIHIRLFMPVIKETFSHRYNDDKTGVLDAFLQHGGMQAMQQFAAGDIGAGAGGMLEGAKKAAPVLIADSIESSLNKTAVTQKGVSIGQRHIATYEGTDIREITLSWDMVPKNLQEVKEIAQICEYIKKHSAASVGSIDVAGVDTKAVGVFNVPGYVYLHEFIPDDTMRYSKPFFFGPAYIQQVTIDKSPSGQVMSLAGLGGESAWTRLTVTFKELIPLTASDI